MQKGLHKSQVFALMLLGCIAGIITASFWYFSFSFFSGLFLGIITLSILGYRQQWFWVSAIVISSFVFGVIRFQTEAAKQSQLEVFDGKLIGVTGYVDGDFKISSGGRGQFPFHIASISGYPTSGGGEKVLVYAAPVPSYKYGEMLEIKGKLFKPESFDGFDYPSYLRVSGIFMTMQSSVIEKQPLYNRNLGHDYKVAVWRKIFEIRDKFAHAIDLSIAEPAAGYVKGILLGLRADLSSELKNAFSRTGTSHVLAISGYNITIIAKYLLAALVYIMRRQKALWVVMAILSIFVIMTGASASVVRAAIMGSLVLVATGIGRLSDARQLLLLAAVIMALINPYTVRFDTGFQLSFAAVAGLIFIQPLLEPYVKKIFRTDFLTDLVSATIAAQIAVTPLLAFYFGTISLVLLMANLAVLPFIPVTMLLGFTTGIAGMFWNSPAQILGALTWAMAQWQIWAVETLGSFSWVSANIEFSMTMVALSYFCIIIVVWWLLTKKNREELLSF